MAKSSKHSMRRGAGTMTYTAIIFVFSLAMLLAIYNSSGSQFQQIQGATTTKVIITTGIINPQIAQQGASNLGTNQITVNATALGLSQSCTFTNILGQLYCNLVSFNLQAQNFGCQLANSIGIPSWLSTCNGQLTTQNPIAKGANQLIANAVGSNIQTSGVSNNGILGIAGSPFNQAMIVVGTFLALGLLAGLFGAGILARVMVLAGLGLSMIIYIEGQMAAFSSMPTYLWWLFNGIMTVIMIIIIHEAFDSGGVG
jgi:hypothetical protein